MMNALRSAVGAAALVALLGGCGKPPAPTDNLAAPKEVAPAVKEAAGPKPAEIAASAPRWEYRESEEKMGRGTIRRAHVESLNEVTFDFPYRGKQRGRLVLIVHPKHGKNVMLQVTEGQFLCPIDGCSVSVKFDDKKVQEFSAAPPSDHTSTVIFIRDYSKFVAAVKSSKKTRIEAYFYQEGARVFEFETDELVWPPQTQGRPS